MKNIFIVLIVLFSAPVFGHIGASRRSRQNKSDIEMLLQDKQDKIIDSLSTLRDKQNEIIDTLNTTRDNQREIIDALKNYHGKKK